MNNASDQHTLWNRIQQLTRTTTLKEFPHQLDMTVYDTMNADADSLDVLVEIFKKMQPMRTDSTMSLIIPQAFLHALNEQQNYFPNQKELSKNVFLYKLRIPSKKAALEGRLTPELLIQETIDKRKQHFSAKPESIREDYGGINYKEIGGRMQNNYFFHDLIFGYLASKTAGSLVDMYRYDRWEEVLDKQKIPNLKPLVPGKDGILTINKDIDRKTRKKILGRDLFGPNDPKIRRTILTTQAERIFAIPSEIKEGEYFKGIRFHLLPLRYPDGKPTKLNDECYANWTRVNTNPGCGCEEKRGFINYIKAGQNYFCKHEIFAFREGIERDWKRGEPNTSGNPYIAVSPFFKPTTTLIEYFTIFKDRVFVKTIYGAKHLDPITISTALEKGSTLGYLQLLDTPKK